MKNIKLSVVDHDHSDYSRQLVNKITSSGYFILTEYDNSYTQSLRSIEQDKSDLVLEIPSKFEKTLVKENEANSIHGIECN